MRSPWGLTRRYDDRPSTCLSTVHSITHMRNHVAGAGQRARNGPSAVLGIVDHGRFLGTRSVVVGGGRPPGAATPDTVDYGRLAPREGVGIHVQEHLGAVAEDVGDCSELAEILR